MKTECSATLKYKCEICDVDKCPYAESWRRLLTRQLDRVRDEAFFYPEQQSDNLLVSLETVLRGG